MDIIVPTRWNIDTLKWLLNSLSIQTYKDFKLNIIIDKQLGNDEFDEFRYFTIKHWLSKIKKINFISNLNSNFIPWSWVSYNRNYILKNWNIGDFVFLLDDDNIFWKRFIEDILWIRLKYKSILKKDLIVSPQIIYRKTNNIQSLWFLWFNLILWNFIKNKDKKSKFRIIKAIWGNSLFWSSKIFKDIMFDEEFKFVYEDIDFTYRVSKKWFYLIISNEIKINHMERDKTYIDKFFLWTDENIYNKAKNRIIFVKKNFNLIQKIIYFIFWFNLQNLWFISLIFILWKDKIWLLKMYVIGTYHWFVYSKLTDKINT